MSFTGDSAPIRPGALTVSELNRQARHLLETSFMQAWVEGELSGLSRPSSGHWYFSLKDDRCQVRCAMFRGVNQRLRDIPKEGDQVRIRGKVTLYENRGDFQIIVEHLEPAGLGALQQAFEALKARLQAEGLFAVERKKPIPGMPRHIGVVTSPTGAAIHDILTVLGRRCPGIPVTVYPTAVQGQAATTGIVDAIARAVRHNRADVLIIGRGGGSLEDLWCFNEEAVARAIAACPIATVSAVGHEVDVTIADFVADLRAPTPSAAAEKVSPDQAAWLSRLEDTRLRLAAAAGRHLRQLENRLSHIAARLRDPRRDLQEKAQRLDETELRFRQAMSQQLNGRRTRTGHLEQRLLAHRPSRHISERFAHIEQLRERLNLTLNRQLERRGERLQSAARTLHAVSPLATLGRGYAIVSSDSQTVVREAGSLAPGDRISARLARGRVDAEVIAIRAEPTGKD
ncbi:Exodeoxyribonuclease VII large subunit [Marinobacter daqiaonensis]|uniref:Exodeoxyribonuclease 7 large subunit n=1 Tax=Marinobacter daqiaonensis TaxID=650891 RepID=A0A1I6H1H0_9GAMM|nr:exodeoxyribonuclease VII large subunit [Marinobacter daqiaonensis]SFR48315.1 Exodeoxyribonuclease VII large subunit [Marinobacter daqiaonensis]